MTDARDTILGAIRSGLRHTQPAALPPLEPGPVVPVAERVATFTAILTKVGGTVDVVADLPAALARATSLLLAADCRTVACSDAPALAPWARSLPSALRALPADAGRAELLAADAGVTFAQFGIAVTGSLVLLSAQEQHRLASLLPPRHVALLPRSRLLGSLGEAFAALRAAGSTAPRSRTITFVTGPSRTADIELELVVGVHGPKFLHAILFDDHAGG